MTVKRDNDGTIILVGECGAEDAETLLEHLQAQAPPAGQRSGQAPTVDWSACTRLHAAVLQVLMAARPTIRGACGDAFVRQWPCFARAAVPPGARA
jgi:hypothetical protein